MLAEKQQNSQSRNWATVPKWADPVVLINIGLIHSFLVLMPIILLKLSIIPEVDALNWINLNVLSQIIPEGVARRYYFASNMKVYSI